MDMIEVNEKVVVFDGLPAGLEGLRILHVSDFHTRGFGRAEQAVYDSMRRLEPDMVVVSGDFCNHFGFSGSLFKSSTQEDDHDYPFISRHGIWLPPEIDTAMEVVGRLLEGFECPLGVWAGKGNHDPSELVRRMGELPIRFLVDSSEVVEYNGVKLAVAGVDCSSRKSTDLVTLLKGVGDNDFTIGISHYPEYGEALIAGGCRLVLSGHTHGGQICLPGGKPLMTHSRTGNVYGGGVVAFLNGWVHVSRGTGKVMLPVRVNCPPEVTMLVLENGKK